MLPLFFATLLFIDPIRVCDVSQSPSAYEDKVVALVGRYSFRQSGRSLSEERCGQAPGTIIRIEFDKKLAPATPDHLEFDAAPVQKLLRAIQQQTALAKFRFGTPDYDRWAVVYGRLETNKPAGRDPVLRLICVGDSEVMFIVDRY